MKRTRQASNILCSLSVRVVNVEEQPSLIGLSRSLLASIKKAEHWIGVGQRAAVYTVDRCIDHCRPVCGGDSGDDVVYHVVLKPEHRDLVIDCEDIVRGAVTAG